MQHQIWNICDVTCCMCINPLQCKALPWRSIIQSVFQTLHINTRVHTCWQSCETWLNIPTPSQAFIFYLDWIVAILTRTDGTIRWKPSKRVNTGQSRSFLEQLRKSQVKSNLYVLDDGCTYYWTVLCKYLL